MNKIPNELAAQVRAALLRNGSLRYVSYEFGIAKKTAQRIRDRLAIPNCPCGRPGGHKAWCSSRPKSIKPKRSPRIPQKPILKNSTKTISLTTYRVVMRNQQFILREL